MALCAPYVLLPIAAAFAVGMFDRLGLDPDIVATMLKTNPTIARHSRRCAATDMVSRTYGKGQFSIDNFLVKADQVIEFARTLICPRRSSTKSELPSAESHRPV